MLNETITPIINRLTDWLQYEGGEVTNLPLDLLNRAQDSLWRYRRWDDLVKRSSALSITNKVATVPADFKGVFMRLGSDLDGDGRLDFFYYPKDNTDNGYEMRDTFDKDTGHTYTFTFYNTPSYDVYMEYMVYLEDFTGTGTEYTFFPGDLLLVEAQYIHIVETGKVGNEYQAITNRRSELIRDYEQAHQFQDRNMEMQQNDVLGNQIFNEQYNLEGAIDGLSSTIFDPSFDRG